MSVDPESLSKEKLKAQLRKNGVTFNQYENKPYYVKLYRDKLLQKELSEAEFSDDEGTGRTPRGSRRHILQKKDSPSSRMNEVKRMSDSTLRSMLLEHGENPGPITATTRSLYERRLLGYLEKSTPKRSPRAVHRYVEYRQQWRDQDKESSFMAQAEEELSDEEFPMAKPMQKVREARTYEKEVVSNYNLRNRYGDEREPPMVLKRGRSPKRDQSPKRDRSSKRDGSPKRDRSPRRDGSPRRSKPRSHHHYWIFQSEDDNGHCYEVLCKLFMLIAVVAVAFLVYDHMTTPTGMKSVAVQGYEYFYPSSLMNMFKPKMCPSKVAPEAPRSSPPPSKEEATPPDDPSKKSSSGRKPSLILKEEENPDLPRAEEKEHPTEPPPKEPKVPPVKEEPKAPAKEEPKAPAKEEPKAPAKEEPKAPAKEEPKAPAKEEPKAPAKEEPKAPAKEEPKAPPMEEPKAPAKEEHLGEPVVPEKEDSPPKEMPEKKKPDNSNKQ